MNTTQTIDLRQAIAMNTPKALDLWLDLTEPSEREYQVAGLSKADRRRFGEVLDDRTAAVLFETLDSHLAAEVVRKLPIAAMALALGDVDPTPLADILRRLDDADVEPVLAAMPIERADVVRGLLKWPAECVGAHMSLEVITVGPTTPAGQAVDDIRQRALSTRRSAVGSHVYVTGADRELRGSIPFRNLVLAAADREAADVMYADIVTVTPLTDAEEAARKLLDHRADELPVVDSENRLLGVLTEDEATDILADEATEDAEKQGGSEPLEVPYLEASPFRLWRKRIVWLLVLFVAEAYTGTVLRAFEDEMEAVVALAFFIPLLIGTGGNTGTQITTTLVRAMGTGQVRFRDLPRVVAKELSTASLIALAMAGAGLIRAFTLGVGPEVMLTVSLTLAAIVLWAALIASVLPLVLKKVRVDPAVVSAPMIATIVDGTGLMIYFLIAHAMLPELAGL